MRHLRVYGASFVVSVLALAAAGFHAGLNGVVLAGILGVPEISLSFDNAVVNARVLEQMPTRWQQVFLTVGVLIAVFGMRLLFPLLVVRFAAGLGPADALHLALNPPPDGASHFADGTPSYETILTGAHPQIAAFGGAFLLMLFLSFMFEEQDVAWIGPIENRMRRLARVPGLATVVTAVIVVVLATQVVRADETAPVLVAGLVGLVTFLVVSGLGELFKVPAPPGAQRSDHAFGRGGMALASGRAALFLFLYLEVLDASFSLDGVVGAFAITSDPILILLGLGAIGAMFVRSITVHLVRENVLSEYRYLSHGAHWAIGALSVTLLLSIAHRVPEVVTGLSGVVFIGASLLSSIAANRDEHRRDARAGTGPAG